MSAEAGPPSFLLFWAFFKKETKVQGSLGEKSCAVVVTIVWVQVLHAVRSWESVTVEKPESLTYQCCRAKGQTRRRTKNRRQIVPLYSDCVEECKTT